jgi:hypothetical protein
MKSLIVGIIILLILSGAIAYIYKSKKNGGSCIGCPHSKECSKCICESNKTKDNIH